MGRLRFYASLNKQKAFSAPRSAKELLKHIEIIKDWKWNQLLVSSEAPIVWAIFANPDKDKANADWHVWLVLDYRETEEWNYEITLVEQNSEIKIDGINYEALESDKNWISAAYSMVVWVSTVTYTKKQIEEKGIKFLWKK